MEAKSKRAQMKRPLESGGPPCPESQADGVPCDELGRDCDDCERGRTEDSAQASDVEAEPS